MNKIKKTTTLIFSVIIFSYFYLLSIDTPSYDDDLYISNHQTIATLFQQAYNDYFNWNGRVVGQSAWRIIVSSNIFVSAFLIAFFALSLILLIQYFSKTRNINKYSLLPFLLSFFSVILFSPVIGQIFFWKAGAGNYLLTTVVILTFILPFHDWYQEGTIKKSLLYYLLPIIGFIAGWSNENTSGGALLIVFIYIILGRFYKKISIDIYQIISIIAYLIGYIFLLIAPGNSIRTRATMSTLWLDQSLLVHFKNGFIAVTKSLIHQYFFLLFLIFVLTLFFMFRKQYTVVINSLIWSLSGLATIYVLSFSPLGQDGGRAFFGGIILIIIALNILLNNFMNINSSKLFMNFSTKIVKISVLFCIIFAGIVVTTIGTIDAHKANLSIKERYNYIIKKSPNTDAIIHVERLSYYPKTKFSVNYGLEELTYDKPHTFPNEGYNKYFNLKGIVLDNR